MYLNRASVFPHNPLNCIEAKPGPLADSLGRKKRLKDARLYVRRNSRTVIANLNHNAIGFTINSHPESAFAVHGVNRIVNDVGPDLVQFAAERIYQQRNRL